MCHFADLLLLLFVIGAGCDANIQSIHTRVALSGHLSGLFPNLTSNSSASSTATKPYQNTHIKSVTNISYPNFHKSKDNITSLPPPFYVPDEWGRHLRNFQHIKAGFCDLGDQFCSFRNPDGTMTKANPTSMEDMCMLWDDSCSGNRTMAIEKFFHSTVDLGGNPCFEQTPGADSSACIKFNPSARLLEWQKIKRWMRSSQCSSALNTYEELNKTNHGASERFYSDVSTCCLRCYIQAENVDLYYWPESNPDTSCLSVIGGSVRPLDYGATKVSVSVLHALTQRVDILTYWGCTASTLKKNILTDRGHLTTQYVRETFTTAQITTIGSLTVKHSAFSPWSSALCPQQDAAPHASEVKVKPRVPDRSLISPSSITQQNHLPVSVVSDDFTFVSPSVYARFHRIQAYDGCTSTTLSPMMLSFAPGEMSTIVGPISVPAQFKNIILNEKRSFDFGDLPCPPQSVMEANWYKPAPGEPYRPLIAMPDQLTEKLRAIDPHFSSCKADFFTAFDPPRALLPLSALLPTESAGEPNPAQVPSPTIDSGFKETIAGQGATPMPPSVPTVNQPKATMDSAPRPTDGSTATQKQSDDSAAKNPSPSQPLNSPGDHTADTNQGSAFESNEDHKQDPGPVQSDEVDPSFEQIFDPNSIAQSSSKQVDAADQVKEESPEKASPVNFIQRPASLDPSDDPTIASGAPALEGLITTINDQVIQQLSYGISIAGTILTPGAPAITASGATISLGSSALVVGTSTVPLLLQPSDPFITTIAGHAITAAPSAIDVDGTILDPGSPSVTLDGTIVSLDTADHLIIGSKTIALSHESTGPDKLFLGEFNDQSSLDVAHPMITTIAGQVITAAPDAVNVAGTTLHPGITGIILDGTAISLDTAGHLIVGSNTIALTSKGAGLGRSISAGSGLLVATVGGQAITAAPNAVAFAGTTLTAGAPGKTVDGTLISLDTVGQLILGSKTIALTSGRAGIGGAEAGGLLTPQGTYSSSSSSSTNETGHPTNTKIKAFEGKAEVLKTDSSFSFLSLKAAVLLFVAAFHFFVLI